MNFYTVVTLVSYAIAIVALLLANFVVIRACIELRKQEREEQLRKQEREERECTPTFDKLEIRIPRDRRCQ